MKDRDEAEALREIYDSARTLAHGQEGWDGFYVMVKAKLEAARQAGAEEALKVLKEKAKNFSDADYAHAAQGGGIYFSADHLRGSAAAYTDMICHIDQALRALSLTQEGAAPLITDHIFVPHRVEGGGGPDTCAHPTPCGEPEARHARTRGEKE